MGKVGKIEFMSKQQLRKMIINVEYGRSIDGTESILVGDGELAYLEQKIFEETGVEKAMKYSSLETEKNPDSVSKDIITTYFLCGTPYELDVIGLEIERILN